MGFYAFALDGEKKVLSTASNVGECLWSGIIAPKRAGRVVNGYWVERLGDPDAIWADHQRSIHITIRRGSVAA